MKKTIKAWAVLDVGGGMKHPSISIFDTKTDAKKDARKLNILPPPTNEKDPTNHIVSCEIIYSLPKKK